MNIRELAPSEPEAREPDFALPAGVVAMGKNSNGNGRGLQEIDILAAAVRGSPLPVAMEQAPLEKRRHGEDCDYDKELRRLQVELVKLQEWVRHKGLKVVVLFEGRDAAGKGGTIKRITECLNPRACRVVALAAPTERERTQWYFQRYVAQLPAASDSATSILIGADSPCLRIWSALCSN